MRWRPLFLSGCFRAKQAELRKITTAGVNDNTAQIPHSGYRDSATLSSSYKSVQRLGQQLFLILGTLAGCLLPAHAGSFPRGVYYVMPSGSASIPTAVVNAEGIVGVMVRDTWTDIEPSENSFYWTNLDNMITAAQSSGLAVEIAIQDGPPMAPSWVSASQTITLWDTGISPAGCVTASAFWDSNYHSAVLGMYEALAAHISTEGYTIAGVMASPFDWDTDDWVFPESSAAHTCTGSSHSDQYLWLQAATGSTSACTSYPQTAACYQSLMLQVAEDVLSTTASNFSSSTIIKLPIHVGVSELEGNGGNNTDGTELLQSVLEYVSSQTFASQVYTQGNFIAADTASSTSGTVPTTLAAAESNSTNQLQDLYFLYYWATDQGYSNMNQRGLQSAAYGTCPGGTCSSCPIGGGASCSACCNEGYEDALVTTVVDDVALSYSPTFFELFNWPNFPITDNTSTLSGATTSMGGTPRS